MAYLQHSEYGSHESVRFNNNSDFKTGYASVKEPTCGWTNDNRDCNRYGTTSDITLPYNTETGYLASTTGNISGIYDMSGGSWEDTMGVMVDENSNPLSGQNDRLNSGFNGKYTDGGSLNTGLNFPKSKYYDKYGQDEGILGDATGEMGPFERNDDPYNLRSSWYNNIGNFLNNYMWINRGAMWTYGDRTGIFSFWGYQGHAANSKAFRLILTPTL